jgi:DNA recombination protein RmuC
LGEVKTEFDKFGGLLQKAQKNINAASDTVEELLGKRSKAINRKLMNVETLPAIENPELLSDTGVELETDGDL